MKRILITGFDPFGGATVNPSWMAVERLPEQIGECVLCKLQIPTVFGKAAASVLDTGVPPRSLTAWRSWGSSVPPTATSRVRSCLRRKDTSTTSAKRTRVALTTSTTISK